MFILCMLRFYFPRIFVTSIWDFCVKKVWERNKIRSAHNDKHPLRTCVCSQKSSKSVVGFECFFFFFFDRDRFAIDGCKRSNDDGDVIHNSSTNFDYVRSSLDIRKCNCSLGCRRLQDVFGFIIYSSLQIILRVQQWNLVFAPGFSFPRQFFRFNQYSCVLYNIYIQWKRVTRQIENAVIKQQKS